MKVYLIFNHNNPFVQQQKKHKKHLDLRQKYKDYITYLYFLSCRSKPEGLKYKNPGSTPGIKSYVNQSAVGVTQTNVNILFTFHLETF